MKALRKIVLATGLLAFGLVPKLALAGDDSGASSGAMGGGQYGAVPEHSSAFGGGSYGTIEKQPVSGEDADAAKVGVGAEAGTDEDMNETNTKTEITVNTPPAEPIVIEHRTTERKLMTPFGMAVAVGGGVMDYTDNDIDALTDTAGAYDARLILGTKAPIGLEAAYVGTAQNVTALGLSNDAVLVSNGAEGLVRVNIGRFGIQPFVFGGAGWQRYSLTNEGANTSSMNGTDDTFSLPFGGGIGSYVGKSGLMLDARFTYRPTFREDLLKAGTGNEVEEDLDNWNVSARVGYEF